MANSSSVWGIEIGQSALKALRCTLQGDEVVADAFDYIEYPKILSQPEAVAEELIADAIDQLLERNDSFREKICISVPGQSGLAKFFKPPPVEVKKISDIVRYEARQQIPFDLADVVWDFQMMPGSMVEEGYALESEVGLFAMKREQAYRQLAPFSQANIEVDVVQMSPIAIYNMIAYDRMNERVENDVFYADSPPPSTVILSIGTDSSDLIITNGFRIWQRSMPIGGNHFTRQLTKDLKLTFAKAEHLKRNAREATDPKLVFQTMRPVFNDLVTEVQRSIGFFRSIHKKAEIDELLVTGNTVKMPGLAAYLGKNLGFDVHVLDRFNRLIGDDVLSIPTFRDNAPTFAVCYGLCLQGLGLSQIHASLVPEEIIRARMIRAKKPWTLAGLAALMIGMAGNYAFTQRGWATTHPDLWDSAQREVTTMSDYSSEHKSKDADLTSRLEYLEAMGVQVSGDAEQRLVWMELIKTINAAIPRFQYPDNERPADYEERKDFEFVQFDTKHYDDLSEWWTEDLARRYRDEYRNWARKMDRELPEDLETLAGPTGEGWVIQLQGYHYYNSPKYMGFEGSQHVRIHLTTEFMDGTVDLPTGKQNADGTPEMETFTFEQMGLTFPLLLDDREPRLTSVPNPKFDPEAQLAGLDPEAAAPPPTEKKDPEPPTLSVLRLDFVYQVVWQPNVLSERLAAKAEAEAAAAEAAEQANPNTDDAAATGQPVAAVTQ